MDLYPKNALEKGKQKHISTEKLINMAEFVLKFVLNNKFQEQPLVQSVLPLTPVYI